MRCNASSFRGRVNELSRDIGLSEQHPIDMHFGDELCATTGVYFDSSVRLDDAPASAARLNIVKVRTLGIYGVSSREGQYASNRPGLRAPLSPQPFMLSTEQSPFCYAFRLPGPNFVDHN